MNSKTFAQNYRRKLNEEKQSRKAFREIKPRSILVFTISATVVLAFYIIALPYVIRM